jgi:polyisoprenoid-binding protein YceI
MPRKVVPMGGKVKKAFARAPLLLGLLLLAACARQAERGVAPVAVPAGVATPGVDATRPPPAGVRRYRIDAARSLLTIRVFRGGALAAAGHNHVIASHDLEGQVDRAPALERSAVSVRIPVARLAIDEPALRAVAGAEFAAEVPESARDGTRRNLLGAASLDGERFPRIELDSTRVAAAPGGARLTLRVRVRGIDSSVEVPITLESQGAELVASGELELRQSQLGLTPFSVMMGALQVQDAMRVQFRLVAVP